MKHSSFFLAGLISTFLPAVAAYGQGQSVAVPTVTSADQFAETQPLRDTPDGSLHHGLTAHTPQPLPQHRSGGATGDAALQSLSGFAMGAPAGVSFPGVGANGSAPPDTNMAVGPSHILQTVNSRYAIYNKAGALILGPNTLSSLWAPLVGSGCAINNGGDVVAQYDKLADRFIVTQLGRLSAPYSECIAISKTSDPTGAYWLYSFPFGTVLNDYPKFGVWPTATNGAYLATYNLFAGGTTFTGAELCAYDRTKMLVGDPTAQGICYTISNDGGYLPSDLDGPTPPLDSTPGFFLALETLSSLRMYALSPNFAVPASSTLTVETPDIPVASFALGCSVTGTCVPQKGTSQQLDSLGDRLMYRLAFRMFGDHEALVVNHSVDLSGPSVGIRWYELRAPLSTSGAFTVFQQGTFAPDATFRWMGSAAMDKVGDIAVGYSASSATLFPAIRYAARVPGDPLGTLEAEVSLIEGTGSQNGGLSRWGDYSAMRIDPSDDCTFWYTNQYEQASGSFNWSTFFGSFKFPSCGASTTNVALAANGGMASASSQFNGNLTPAKTIDGDRTGAGWPNTGGWAAASPAQPSWLEVDFSGAKTINEIDVFSLQNNFASPSAPTLGMTCTLYCLRDFQVQYDNGGTWVTVPGGAIAGNNHVWVQVQFAAITTNKIRVSITSGAPADGYSRLTEVEAWSTGPPVPDFSIAASPSSLTLTQGASGTSTVTVTALNGFSSSVGLSVTGCPSGATCSLPTPVTPTATSTLSVSTTTSTSTGTVTLTITGTSGALTHATTVSLTVNSSAHTNVALATKGGIASASSQFNGNLTPAKTIDGDRTGAGWPNTGGWAAASPAQPSWLEVDFSAAKTINEIDVFSLQNNYASPSAPTLGMTFTLYGLRDFLVQYDNGGTWTTVPGGALVGNNHVWVQISFAAITTTKIRVYVTSGAPADGYSRLTEVEAWTP